MSNYKIVRNFKDINPKNQYIKLYYRLLKEKNLYNTKEMKSLYRYQKDYPCYIDISYINNRRTMIKNDSILYNLDIPNMFIATSVEYMDYYKIHRDYAMKIMKPLVRKMVRKIFKEEYVKINENDSKIKLINKAIKEIIDECDYELMVKGTTDNPTVIILSKIKDYINKNRNPIREKFNYDDLKHIANSIKTTIVNKSIKF